MNHGRLGNSAIYATSPNDAMSYGGFCKGSHCKVRINECNRLYASYAKAFIVMQRKTAQTAGDQSYFGVETVAYIFTGVP